MAQALPYFEKLVSQDQILNESLLWCYDVLRLDLIIASTIKTSLRLCGISMQVNNNTSMRAEKGVCQTYFP